MNESPDVCGIEGKMHVLHEPRMRVGNVSVKDQIVDILGFASHTLSQLLNSAVVA